MKTQRARIFHLFGAAFPKLASLARHRPPANPQGRVPTWFVAGIALAVVGGVLGCAGPFRIGPDGFGVRLSKPEIQGQIDSKAGFPFSRSVADLAKVKIDRATLLLVPSDNSVGLSVPAVVSLPFKTYKGTIGVTTEPEYDSKEGALYVSHLKVRELHLPGLPSELESPVILAVNQILDVSVGRYQVHKLDRGKLGENVARLLLKEIKVQEDGVFFRLVL